MKLFFIKITSVITTFIFGLFLVSHTVSALDLYMGDMQDACNQYWTCAECMTKGQSSNCIWVQGTDTCMNRDKLYGYPTGDYYRYCASQQASSTPTPTAGSYYQPTSIPRPTSTPRPYATKKPTSTPTSVPGRAYGKSCKSNSDCVSGNCKNGVCCARGETCCTKHSSCPDDEYCSVSHNRYYCRTKLKEGVSCTEDYQCQSLYCDSDSNKCAPASEARRAVCGNKSCDYWLGETCTSCHGDCDNVSDFCCSEGSQYANTWDWQNKVFVIFDPPGGLIPEGRLVMAEGITENMFFNHYQPRICSDGEIISGECTKSYQCVKGICMDNKCTTALSDETEEITDEEESQEIFDDQMEYQNEEIWVNIYDRLDDDLISFSQVPGELEFKLEVQGSTAGDMPEATVGKDVEVRLTVVNTTHFSMEIVAGITYPGQLAGTYDLEEKKYTLTCSPVNGTNPLTTVIGTANAKRYGGKSFILPSNHQLVVYSKIKPKQEGYLDIAGIIYFSKEKMYANTSLVEMAIAPTNFEDTFEKREVNDSILVNKRKCRLPLICI